LLRLELAGDYEDGNAGGLLRRSEWSMAAPQDSGPGQTGAMTAKSDEDLLIRVGRERDRAALGELVTRHHGRLYHIALRMCGSATSAEDAVQDSFLRIWRVAGQYRSGGNPWGWMAAVVASQVARQRRGRARAKAREQSFDAEHAGRTAEHSTAAGLEGEELRHALHHALEELTSREKELVALYYGAGLTQKQIAGQLSLTQRTISDHLNRTVEKLRRSLGKQGLLAGAHADPEACLRAAFAEPSPVPPNSHPESSGTARPLKAFCPGCTACLRAGRGRPRGPPCWRSAPRGPF